MYALLVAAAFLFALQFLFSQNYREASGEGLRAAMTFNMYVSSGIFVLMLLINRFHWEINWFSMAVSLGSLVVSTLSTYSSLKVLGVANLSVYSIFSMLGGMLLPFLFGVLFYEEPLTVPKVLCVLLIALSLILTVEKGGKKGRTAIYYAGIFVLNGMAGVLSKLHQSSVYAVDSTSYVATCNLITASVSAAFLLIRYKKLTPISWKVVGNIGLYAVCNGVGNLLVLIALTRLPASVQYPIITGGVMVFATIISILRKERLTKATMVSTVAALAATILIMF